MPQILAVLEHSFCLQYLRDPVIREHSQLMNVFELSQTTSVELPVDISDEDLGSFVKMDLVALENTMILEVREAFS